AEPLSLITARTRIPRAAYQAIARRKKPVAAAASSASKTSAYASRLWSSTITCKYSQPATPVRRLLTRSLLARAAAADPVADAADPPQLLDIDVDKLAWMTTLVPVRRLRRL